MITQKSQIVSLGYEPKQIVGRLTHDLAAAVNAKRGRWAAINEWVPDPDSSPIRNPEPEDVLDVSGVSASAFRVSGDITDELHDGFPILIRGSTPNAEGYTNDGLYFLDGEPGFAAGETTVTISGVLPDVGIVDGELVIVRPTVLKPTNRIVLVVSRSNTEALAQTFVKATPVGFEYLIDVINCTPESDEE